MVKKLSDKEQAVLECLTPTDKADQGKLRWDVNHQRRLIGALLTDPKFVEKCGPIIKAEYFSDAMHSTVVKFLLGFYEKYNGLPEKSVVSLYVETAYKEKDEAIQLAARAEVESLYKFYVPGFHTRQYYCDQILEFAKIQKGKLAIHAFLDNCGKGQYDKAIETAISGFQDAQKLSVNQQVLKWSELKALAEEQSSSYVFENILELATLTLVCGLPYSGKTTLIAHLIAAIAQDRSLFHFDLLQRVPVVFLNCDRTRERILFKRIDKCIKDDVADMDTIFYLPKEVPAPLNLAYVAALVERINRPGIIVIDTLRSAFLAGAKENAENDAAQMSAILNPLRSFCRTSGWAVLLLHHNNKQDSYAGSTAISGNTDSLWTVRRDEDSKVAKVFIKNRDGQMFNLQVRETDEGLVRVDTDEGHETALVEFMTHFPTTIDAAWTPEDVKCNIPAYSSYTDRHIKNILHECERPGKEPRLEKVGNGRRGDPLRWFKV